MKVPPSKSMTHRALFCAGLAHGESILINPLVCDDTLATASALEMFGVSIQKEKERWIVNGTNWQTPSRPIDCNETATTYRFLKAMTESFGIACEITGRPSLLKRMVGDSITSQFLSGELLATPLGLSLRGRRPKQSRESSGLLRRPASGGTPRNDSVSKPYIALTLSVQKKFGVDPLAREAQRYQPAILEIEGDWSSAAFLLAAGVLTKGVALEGLNPDSVQGDKAIVTILKEMGADIFWEAEKLVAKPSSLRAIDWDFSQTPDLYPIVAVLNALAKGKGNLTGTERLRFKESDRVAEMEKITKYPVPYEVRSTDHRVVMAVAVLNLATGGKIVLKNPQCVAKSFPDFWNVYGQFTR